MYLCIVIKAKDSYINLYYYQSLLLFHEKSIFFEHFFISLSNNYDKKYACLATSGIRHMSQITHFKVLKNLIY